MDRNEKQNSYKNMISTRGNNREINRLKKRFRLMSVLVVILLAVVIVLGILLGKTWMDSKKNDSASGANRQEEKQGIITEDGNENGNTEATEETKTDDIVVMDGDNSSPEAGGEAGEGHDGSEKADKDEGDGGSAEKPDANNPGDEKPGDQTDKPDSEKPGDQTEKPENGEEVSQESNASSTEITEENLDDQPDGAQGSLVEDGTGWINLLQNVLNQHTDTDKYRIVTAEKSADSVDFDTLSEAGTWSDSIGSDDLAMLFLVGKAYQCLNDSFNGKPTINADGLRNYCLEALNRVGGADVDQPENIILQRIGETVYAERGTAGDQGITDEEKEAAGLESVNAMLEEALGNHGSKINGFDKTTENGIYLKDLLAYFQKFENADIWSNENKSYDQDGQETQKTTRNNLKSLFLENSTKEGGSDFISKLKSQLGASWNVYWVEDQSTQSGGSYLALLIEENADKEDSQKKAVVLGLFADAIENASWSEELANAIAQELANPGTAKAQTSMEDAANAYSGVTNELAGSDSNDMVFYTEHGEQDNPD